MAKLLVIDDDPDMLKLIRKTLEKDGHQVDVETDPAPLHPDRCRQYDLILLDVMIPGENGFSFCRRIRQDVDCPILFLTAKTEEAALVEGFGLGGDDYIKKPFSLTEIRARVAAHLRREKRQPTHTLNRGGLRFDMQAKTISAQEHLLSFTKGEYGICEYLALHPGQVFTKEQLYESVFGLDAEGDSSAIAEHIKNIRSKLRAEDLNPIETVWGWAINGEKTTFSDSFFCSSPLHCHYAWLYAAMQSFMAGPDIGAAGCRIYISWLCFQPAGRRNAERPAGCFCCS